MWFAAREILHVEHRERFRDARGDLRLRPPLFLQAKADILLHRKMRKQRVGLEHHVHRPRIGGRAGHVLAVDLDPARVRCLKSRDHAEQRRLSGTRPAEQAKEFAAGDVQIHRVDRGHRPKTLDDGPDADDRPRCAESARVQRPVLMRVHSRFRSRSNFGVSKTAV
jgi:hypothetical protein